MKTTLTLDEDPVRLVCQRARELDRPFCEVVNSALRGGLANPSPAAVPEVTVRPHDFGASLSGIGSDRFNQLPDDLDIEEFLRLSLNAST